MTTPLEVRPRYTDPDFVAIDIPAAADSDPGASSTESATRGLFTSMYENKIIVFCIVLFIIIIGVVAWIVTRQKESGDSPSQKSGAAAEVPRKTSTPPTTSTPPAPTKTNLESLLAKSQQARAAAATRPDTAPQVEQLESSVDDSSHSNSSSESDQNSLDDTTIDLPAAQDHVDATCTATLASGRQCKNKVRNGGRCAKHSN